MRKVETYQLEKQLAESGRLMDIFVLIKARLTLMVVFTSVIAYALVSSFQVSVLSVILLFVGGFFVAGAANALNQALERDFDKMMTRTAGRPVASAKMSMSTAVMIAGLFSLVGITILALFNPLTAFLGTLSLLTYAFVYTPLKRHSTVAVLVGAIPGAMPVLIGCVAYEGTISNLALSLFVIQFLWQIPHFWAIAFLAFEEYQKAGFEFIPTKNGKISSGIMYQAVVSCLLLIPLTYLTAAYLELAIYYSIAVCLVSAGFSILAFQFLRNKNRNAALKLMFGSLIFLPLVLSILLISQF